MEIFQSYQLLFNFTKTATFTNCFVSFFVINFEDFLIKIIRIVD